MGIRENIIFVLDKVNSNKLNRVNDMLEPNFVDYDEEKRTITISYKVKDWEKNVRDEVHGGAVASMFDFSMGATTVAFYNRKQIATVELSVNYIRPFLDEEYLFIIEMVHPGRKLARVQAEAVSKKTGKLAATCTATFIPLDKEY